MKGGFIWDDPDYMVNNHARASAEGLWDIWTNIRSIPQWYPLVHTSYWIEYHLWGLNPFGYHLVNVLLHAGGAVLLWKLLKKLNVSAACSPRRSSRWHPLHVESVAWVTERKNTLSAFLYFAAVLAYLRTIFAEPIILSEDSDQKITPRDWAWYGIAFVLFAGAMFSKTVSCSFPAAIFS